MKKQLDQVRQFHEKHGFPVGQDVSSIDAHDGIDRMLDDLSSAMATTCGALMAQIEDGVTDLRVARTQLMIEELGELVQAMRDRDEIQLADAVTDLAYVVVGTAVAFGMPLEQLFDEVHRSNMTKHADGSHKPTKGPGYSKPRIQLVMREARS